MLYKWGYYAPNVHVEFVTHKYLEPQSVAPTRTIHECAYRERKSRTKGRRHLGCRGDNPLSLISHYHSAVIRPERDCINKPHRVK